MGGYLHWEEAMHIEANPNIYFDLSSTLPFIDKKILYSFIQKQGVDKLLFGSDFPMWDPYYILKLLEGYQFSRQELKAITYDNFVTLHDKNIKWRKLC